MSYEYFSTNTSKGKKAAPEIKRDSYLNLE